ncbi:hypothetical protein GCM10009859_18210 [Kocuria salsicia]
MHSASRRIRWVRAPPHATVEGPRTPVRRGCAWVWLESIATGPTPTESYTTPGTFYTLQRFVAGDAQV